MLDERDMEVVFDAIKSSLPGSEIFVGEVVARNEARKWVYLAELKDQPIPLVYFNSRVKIYQPIWVGWSLGGYTFEEVWRDVEVKVPEVGDVVVCVRQMGQNHLTKCIGILQSRTG